MERTVELNIAWKIFPLSRTRLNKNTRQITNYQKLEEFVAFEGRSMLYTTGDVMAGATALNASPS